MTCPLLHLLLPARLLRCLFRLPPAGPGLLPPAAACPCCGVLFGRVVRRHGRRGGPLTILCGECLTPWRVRADGGLRELTAGEMFRLWLAYGDELERKERRRAREEQERRRRVGGDGQGCKGK